jgi:hypothetical protein
MAKGLLEEVSGCLISTAPPDERRRRLLKVSYLVEQAGTTETDIESNSGPGKRYSLRPFLPLYQHGSFGSLRIFIPSFPTALAGIHSFSYPRLESF